MICRGCLYRHKPRTGSPFFPPEAECRFLSAENVVYNELLERGYDVYIGKTKDGEIDFIATKTEEKIYIQVTYLLESEKVINREFGAFEEIKDNYPKYVLSLDNTNFSRQGIIHKNIIDWLLESN